MKFCTSVLLTCVLTVSTFGWHSGRRSTPTPTQAGFGMHDWIAFEGYLMAKDDAADIEWLTDNIGMFLYATEVPDNGVIPSVIRSLHPDGRYHDQGGCHCIYFDERGNVTNDRMEVRAQEEFDKAKAALAAGNKRLASFYVGTMAHYLGDLSQFMHMMVPNAPERDRLSHNRIGDQILPPPMVLTRMSWTRSSTDGSL